MYYYVLEAPASRAIRQNYQKLRDILTNLGIAGEMVTASPARSPVELTVMGIKKGYSTIVAVGGDDHVNQIATSLHGQAVLGVIPINASRQVTDIVGVNDIRSAAESLKQRRLSTQSMVFVEPDKLLFLDGEISTEKMAKVSMVIDNKVRAHAYFQRLTIDRDLNIRIYSNHVTEKKKFLGLFTVGSEEMQSESLFHGKTIRILTDPTLPLKIAGNVIADTPFQMRHVPESLKLITKRGTLLE